MKLPKGIKRLRAPASEEGLSKSLDLAMEGGFNGYLRTTAPKGVKEASVVLFMDGSARIAVFQSPQRSLYGPDALHEVKRIVKDPKATIRVEEFLAQNLDEVQVIVDKMRKAHVQNTDIERVLAGVEVEPSEDASRKAEEDIAASIEEELEEEKQQAAGEEPAEEQEQAGEEQAEGEEGEEGEEEDKVGAVRARVTDRIARSKEAAVRDDDEFLRMMKEAGMAPSSDEGPMDDEVNQYIAAFEDFIQRTTDEDVGRSGVDVAAELTTAVDNILDDMLEAASDDPGMMEFIEGQRERILVKVASLEPSETARERHDRLSEQQMALEHISSTFSEVLAASEAEAERRREELTRKKEEGEAEDDWFEDETKQLEEDKERQTGLQSILERVMTTHQERLESAQVDVLDEEVEAAAEERSEEERAKERLDLDRAKDDFLAEMRSRIQSASAGNGDDSAPGKVAEAVHGVADDIHDKVDEIEQEHDVLTKERAVLEGEAKALQEKVDTMSVDMEVEVQARLRDLEDKEEELQRRSSESKELEKRLETERSKIEKDLEQARSEIERVKELETDLKEREDLLTAREKELDDKHEEVDGLKEHLEEEIATRAAELEEMSAKLEEQERGLLDREKEVDASLSAMKQKREEGVDADLERVRELEDELKKREADYSDTISTMERVIEALQEELRDNIEKVEALEGQLSALQETEGRVKELEEQLASAQSEERETMDKEELRKLLAYLDDLLSKLPEKEIEKFSKTEYFEMYGRILDRLGI